MAPPIHLLIQGMYLRADSIAYDTCVHRRLLEGWGIRAPVFAERYDPETYPGIDAKPLDALEAAIAREPGPILYHWVDGWQEGDELLARANVPVILRWHNNTPPWFFGKYSPVPTHRTVRGFLELLRVAEVIPEARIWTNSEFSKKQLVALGLDDRRIDVVYPASTYLERAPAPAPRSRNAADPIRLLFVGRVVPHKGHLHLLSAARALAAMTGREVRCILPGRPDGDMPAYEAEVRALAKRLDVPIEVPGEVTHDELERAYQNADAFVGLSEHEGFGLPILEAMTRGLPVVGYRSTAVAELLADHPLAVDDLDPVGVARRVIAALDPAVRDALVRWQIETVLPRFSLDVIAGQLRAGVRSLGFEVGGTPADAGEPAGGPAPAAVSSTLERALSLPTPDVDLPRDLPRDIPPHFVSRYDLEAYRVLLRPSQAHLRDRALGIEFGSHRPTVGGLMGLLKTGVLRLQDGLLRTIEMSHTDLEHQLDEMNDRVDDLSLAIKRLAARSKRTGPD